MWQHWDLNSLWFCCYAPGNAPFLYHIWGHKTYFFLYTFFFHGNLFVKLWYFTSYDYLVSYCLSYASTIKKTPISHLNNQIFGLEASLDHIFLLLFSFHYLGLLLMLPLLPIKNVTIQQHRCFQSEALSSDFNIPLPFWHIRLLFFQHGICTTKGDMYC